MWRLRVFVDHGCTPPVVVKGVEDKCVEVGSEWSVYEYVTDSIVSAAHFNTVNCSQEQIEANSCVWEWVG